MKKVLNTIIAFVAVLVLYIVLDKATAGFISNGIVGYISLALTIILACFISDFLNKNNSKK